MPAEDNGYKIAYYAPQPRAVVEVVDFDDYDTVVDYGADRPRDADDADEGVLRAALPGARRGRARAALRQVPVGRRQRRPPVPRNRGATTVGVLGRCYSAPAALLEAERPLIMPTWRTTEHDPHPCPRWGEPYKSLEVDKVVHFAPARAGRGQPGQRPAWSSRDMRHAQRARDVLREIPIADLLQMVKKAGDLYAKAELPLGDGTQTPDQFVRMQSATTGLPEHMCRFNMEKNHFVLGNMDKILDALTRGLDLDILSRGYGVEDRGVPVSYQCQSPVLGMVLPSNSPGVHTLWLPIIPLQVGLVLKPGPQEPWTPYRMAAGVRPGRHPEAGRSPSTPGWATSAPRC